MRNLRLLMKRALGWSRFITSSTSWSTTTPISSTTTLFLGYSSSLNVWALLTTALTSRNSLPSSLTNMATQEMKLEIVTSQCLPSKSKTMRTYLVEFACMWSRMDSTFSKSSRSSPKDSLLALTMPTWRGSSNWLTSPWMTRSSTWWPGLQMSQLMALSQLLNSLTRLSMPRNSHLSSTLTNG